MLWRPLGSDRIFPIKFLLGAFQLVRSASSYLHRVNKDDILLYTVKSHLGQVARIVLMALRESRPSMRF